MYIWPAWCVLALGFLTVLWAVLRHLSHRRIEMRTSMSAALLFFFCGGIGIRGYGSDSSFGLVALAALIGGAYLATRALKQSL